MCRSLFHTPSQYGGVEVTFLACALVLADWIRVVGSGKIACVDRIISTVPRLSVARISYLVYSQTTCVLGEEGPGTRLGAVLVALRLVAGEHLPLR